MQVFVAGDRTYTYTAQKVISCGNAQISTKAEASCNFTNKCAQTISKSFVFTIIRFGEQYCAAEGDWQDTKAGFTAEIKCINQAGSRKRPCNNQGNWGPEVSECVNQDLHDVLQFAHISDNGLGELDANAAQAFSRFNKVTRTATLATVANVNTSVEVLQTLNSKIKSIQNVSAIDNFLSSSSNLLNETLQSSWNSTTPDTNFSMADTYLSSVEELVKKANISDIIKKANIEVVACRNDSCNNTVFNVTISLQSSSTVKLAGFKYLQTYLSSSDNTTEPNSIVVSATTEENDPKQDITIDFRLLKDRPRNVEIRCVFRDSNESDWSSNGCHWAGPDNQKRCICHHLSSFAILMSKEPLKVPFLDEITYVGLGVSVLSLFISLLIEFIVWKDVVKTNTLHLRHTAHVNISLCLLVADACFLASSESTSITEVWCRTSAVLKHFCYLAMFFWMLCLSTTLLHQAVFLFHKVSKTNYLRFSLVLGYGCPLIIVFVTFLTNNAGGEGVYYSRETCWLVYTGLLQGSIFTFIIPLSVIVFVNVFSMLVVIMKLLSHHQNADTAQETEKAAAKTVLRSVILLTPIFGITWIFGLAIMIIDLTSGVLANVINYTFVVLNSFQGLFILLTSYLCDKNTREALMKRLRKKAPVSSMSESTTSTTKTNLESFKK
ncbi:adhesion G-protein coupled receptor F3 [Austrofundulus limnaeus]|uniref:Adhesion G-protein coupled receptor F3 n=1 Tax=Austrofundulus limnaeus TaxID=52670 RepID=A0A2I4CP77_AUSLI|nr:PREDICTED: adhesion G-protein coupled receptor F3-like [Austrofundulus limnaeus]